MCMCVFSHSVMFDSLQPHGLQPARLLCPWGSPGRNTGVDCHALCQEIFPTQGSDPVSYVSCSGRRVLYHQCHLGSPQIFGACQFPLPPRQPHPELIQGMSLMWPPGSLNPLQSGFIQVAALKPLFQFLLCNKVNQLYIYSLFFRFYSHISLHSIEQSSLCYTVGSYQLSILYIVAYICQSPSPSLSLLPFPLGNHKFVFYICDSFCFVHKFICPF